MADAVVVKYVVQQCMAAERKRKKRKAYQLVKHMFGDADASWEAGPKQLQKSPRREPRAIEKAAEELRPAVPTINSLIEVNSFSSQIWTFLLLFDLEKLAQCSNTLHSIVRVRIMVIHALSARCANARSLDTAAAAQQLQLELEPAIKRLSADRRNRCFTARNFCDQALFEIQQLVTSPPPILETQYLKYMRQQQPPTQLQVALFVDFILSWRATPVCVFLSPTAGMRKDVLSGKWVKQDGCRKNRGISTDLYRARYGLLDYILSLAVPVTVETPEGKIMGIPLGVAPAQNSRIDCDQYAQMPRDLAAGRVARQISRQLQAIYGKAFE